MTAGTGAAPSRITARAPAKLNLALCVAGPRADGFHEVATVYHAVSLQDDVTVTPAQQWGLRVHGPQADLVPLDGANLALKAARLLAERAGIREPVHLRIDKQIPVAGGMAGGSADAAAALVACDALWGTALSRAELADLAAELGSDVPFSLVGGTAVGTGRGDRLTPALARGSLLWVLAITEAGLSTPEVYAELDRQRARRVLPEPRVPDALMSALRQGEASGVGAALTNDLQPAALRLAPHLRAVLDVGLEAGALGAVVSGSGPTVAFLARDGEQSLDLAVALTASGVAHTVRRAHGPVPGARVCEPVRAQAGGR